MNTLPDSLLAALRCPLCHSPELSLATDPSTHWATCRDCGQDFTVVRSIPYLCAPELAREAGQDATLDAKPKPVQGQEEPDIEAVTRANRWYHDAMAEHYESDVSTKDMFDPQGNCAKRIHEVLSRAASDTEAGLLVDVACGTGNILGKADPLFDTALGLDISSSMMTIARERGLTVLGADAFNLPLADQSADCVTAFSALHHFQDYLAVTREMARVLKPGGVFYTDWDPNGHVPHTGWAVRLALALFKWYQGRRNPEYVPDKDVQDLAEYHHHHGEGFSGEALAKVLEEQGFSRTEVHFHFNPASFDEPQSRSLSGWVLTLLKAVSFIRPTRKNTLPWVAVLAVK